MHERLFVLETTSAHLRELLREACARVAPATVFASTRAARTAMQELQPLALVVGGAPLPEPALDLMRDAVNQHGVSALACVDARDMRRAQQFGALDGYARDAAGIEALANRLRGIMQLHQISHRPPTRFTPSSNAQPVSIRSAARQSGPVQLIAIGASTGGPDAIAYLMAQLPAHLPGIVIVQHMPASHTGAFAQRLDEESRWRVREARDGDAIESGLALIAPGGQHLRLQSSGLAVALSREGPPSFHMPSVDVLFESAAHTLTANTLGILLTGMGGDGAQGLLAMRHAGACTMVQDEASCAVFGMPRRAIELEAAAEVVALTDMPERIIAHCAITRPQSP